MSDSTNTSGGVGFLSLLALLFIALKLTGFVTWSWWWVTLPLWGGLAAMVLALGVVAVVMVVGAPRRASRRRR